MNTGFLKSIKSFFSGSDDTKSSDVADQAPAAKQSTNPTKPSQLQNSGFPWNEKKLLEIVYQHWSESEGSSGLLLELASASVEASNMLLKQQEGAMAAVSMADDPEAATQQMLEQAKRQAAIDQQNEAYLSQIRAFQQTSSFMQRIESQMQIQECTFEQFLDTLSTWMCRSSDEEKYIQILFDVGSGTSGKSSLSIEEATDVISACYQLSVACNALDKAFQNESKDDDQDAAERAGTSADGTVTKLMASNLKSFLQYKNSNSTTSTNTDQVTAKDFQEWSRQSFPGLPQTLARFMERLIFAPTKTPPGIVLPFLDEGCAGSMLASTSMRFIISSMIPPSAGAGIQNQWDCLYDSSKDGWSLNRLEHSIQGYKGPNLMLVKGFDEISSTPVTWGGLAMSPWKTSSDFFGEAFVFHLEPSVEVFRSTPTVRRGGGNYQYFYTKENSDCAQGLGFGGSSKQPRFFVSSALDKSYVGRADTSFQNSVEWFPSSDDASPDSETGRWLELEGLEVWGLGGDSALEALDTHRDRVESHLNKARKVDKAAFLGDFRSGLIDSKMFVHREQMRGRAGGEDCLVEGHAGGDDNK